MSQVKARKNLTVVILSISIKMFVSSKDFSIDKAGPTAKSLLKLILLVPDILPIPEIYNTKVTVLIIVFNETNNFYFAKK